jgi:hypothetical protein
MPSPDRSAQIASLLDSINTDWAAEQMLHAFDPKPYMSSISALLQAGRFEDAVLCYDALLLVAPDLHPSLWQRGLALFYTGRFAEVRPCPIAKVKH